MAQFLIVATPQNTSTQRGDIIAVRADDQQWGAKEGLVSGFGIYRQPGLTREEFEALQPEPGTRPWLEEALLPPDLIDIAESQGVLDGTAEGLPVFLGALKWR